MVVKEDISVNHLVGLREGIRFVAVDTLRFEDGEEMALSYGFPFLDMEGVMPYA